MITPIILLNNNKVQNFIANRLTNYFEEATHAKFELGHISIKFFNEITIDSVYLGDINGEELAYINHLNAKINLFSLLKGDISFNKIKICDLYANVQIDETGKPNFQFLIDAFRPKEKRKVPNIKLPLITLENATIHYTNLKNGKNSNQGFDINNITINNLNTQIQFYLTDKSNIRFSVYYLNCKEKNGLYISNLQTQTTINDSTLTIPCLNLDLTNTHISLDSIHTKLIKNNGTFDLAKTYLKCNILKSDIYLPDLSPIIPQLKKFKEKAYISSSIHGTLKKLNVKNFEARYGNDLSLNMNFTADSIFNIRKTFFDCNIRYINFNRNAIQDVIKNINTKNFILPKELNNLGNCRYTGRISGQISNLDLHGFLNSNIGNIKTNFNLKVKDKLNTFKINGIIGSDSLNLDLLFPNVGLGRTTFNSNSIITFNTKHDFIADTKINIKEFNYKGYKYNNILIDGKITPNLFSGKFLLDDTNGYINFDGTISEINKYKKFSFKAEVNKLNLNRLNIINTYPNLDISFSTNSNFHGEDIAAMNGYINIDSLNIKNGRKFFNLNKLSLVAENNGFSSAEITSDILKGEIYGEYHIASLYDDIAYSISKSMPILKHFDISKKHKKNEIQGFIEIKPLKPLFDVLDINWFTTKKSNIEFEYSSLSDIIDLDINVPQISNNKLFIDSIAININNKSDIINANILAQTNLKNGKLKAILNLNAKNDSINSSLKWDNNSNKLFAGEIATKTALFKSNKENYITTNTTILPTEIILLNKSWLLNKSSILSDINKIVIDNFKIRSEDDQLISINGTASNNRSEKIEINLDDISLNYINMLLPEETEISFGGIVNGEASICNLLEIPEIKANVTSNNFYFDDTYFGIAKATCDFDNKTTSLKFKGTVMNDDLDTTANLNGNYFILNDSLDIKGNAYGLDIKFIDYYISKVFGKVTGKAYGKVHIYGITKSKNIAVDVDALADNASVYVDFLKTQFFFTDSIHLDKNVIDFGTIDIKDKYGNKGVLSGKINHEFFRKIKLGLAINVNNMLVLDTKRDDNEIFFGKVFGTGNVRINGDDEAIHISCKAKSEQNTSITIPIDNYYASENSFIIFQNSTNAKVIKDTLSDKSQTNIILDLMIDVTPDANVQLMIDSKAGDMLKGTGNGNLRITYNDNSEDLNIYGSYQIEQGNYLFTFQNAIRKEFQIKEGSSISWTGDPLNAKVNIDAYYQLTADLAEILDKAILSNTSRTSVPVQCLLNLTGNLTQPNIKFDINLPNSEEELNRALKNAVNTEELMNRQIIGLLILGKFLSPETMQNSVISQNELYSVVSSTLSAQLNNLASQMFNNWGFGVNFRTSGEGETRSNEYEFNFVYTPTERLIINGNLGYRDDALSSTNFIGDFDIEYKLIQSGKLRAKAYTHTNDYREFKKGLTTQGIGLVYSESFNNLTELWQSWKENIRKNKEEYRIKKEARKRKRAARKLAREEKKKELSKNDRKD